MWSFAGGRGKEKLEPDDDVPENEQVNTGKIHSVISLSHHSLKKVSGEEASLLNQLTGLWAPLKKCVSSHLHGDWTEETVQLMVQQFTTREILNVLFISLK